MDTATLNEGRRHSIKRIESTHKIFLRGRHTHILHPYWSNQRERTFVEQELTEKMAPRENSREKASFGEGEHSKGQKQTIP